MYYDESTALDFEVLSKTAVLKLTGISGQTTYDVSTRYQIKTITKVTVNQIERTAYSVTKKNGAVNSITFTVAPANGAAIRIYYYQGEPAWYNSWTDFKMVPKDTIPTFATPRVKTQFTDDLGGTSTWWDYTDAIQNEAAFKPVSGNWSFQFPTEDADFNWKRRFHDVQNTLSGKKVNVYNASDPNWYRCCRLDFSTAKTQKGMPYVTIEYTGDPFEHFKYKTNEDIPWDDLCFEDDPILPFRQEDVTRGMRLNSYGTWSWESGWFTWDREVHQPILEHDASHTLWVELRWRAKPVEEDEGTGLNKTDYDTTTGTINLGQTVKSENVVFRPGQLYLIYTTNGGTSTSYNDSCAVNAREGRL